LTLVTICIATLACLFSQLCGFERCCHRNNDTDEKDKEKNQRFGIGKTKSAGGFRNNAFDRFFLCLGHRIIMEDLTTQIKRQQGS
jgi:hypothetical protein